MSDIDPTMSNFDHQVTFAPQINATQVKHIAEKGYKTIICNRPNGESEDQPHSDDIEQACKEAGLAFKSVAFSGGMLTQDLVEDFADFFNASEQPVYMYCRSGNRSNMIYQASIQLDLLD